MEQIKPVIEAEIVSRILEEMYREENIYMVGVLIEYTRKQSVINRKFINELGKKLLSEERYLEALLKTRKGVNGIEQFAITDKSNPTQLIYYVEVFKLMNIIC